MIVKVVIPDSIYANVYFARGEQGPQGPQGLPGDATGLVDTAYTIVGGTSGTQPTFSGSPLFSGSYTKLGAQVHFQIQVDMDNITSFGTGQYYMDLPFTSKYGYQFSSGCLHDISTGVEYPIFGHVYAGEKRMYLQTLDNQGNRTFQVDFTRTDPVTLTTADNFHVSGTYITSEV
jgi:hypothetical protein